MNDFNYDEDTQIILMYLGIFFIVLFLLLVIYLTIQRCKKYLIYQMKVKMQFCFFEPYIYLIIPDF